MDERIDIQEFYKGLDIMFSKKDSKETMRYLESWLKEAKEKEDLSAVTAVANELGGLCRATGQLERALELSRTVLKNLEQMGLSDTEHYATALINMGDVYINAKEPQKALELFLRARKLLEKRGLTGDYRMAALCNNISAIYRETGQFAEAEADLEIAFRIIKGLPQCRGELATTYVNLGELQVRQNKLRLARESFEQAIAIFEQETGGQDVHYSAACAGLGEVFFLTGDAKKAETWYKKAMELIERDFGRTPYYKKMAENLQKVRGGQSAR